MTWLLGESSTSRSDGAWAVASALWVSRISFAMWPVLFEGVASLALGLLALAGPSCPATRCGPPRSGGFSPGVLKLVAATRLPRGGAGAWLLLTGGGFSLFLALLILVLPHAVEPLVARAVRVQAVLFDAVLAAGSLRTVMRTR
jgi:uncharacterized membrane protein HdeD (DUF308 family)